MRTLLAIPVAPLLLTLSGLLALSAALSPADAARRDRRAPGPSYYAPPNAYYAPAPPAISQRQVCEERAQAADPTGLYAGYPCWAREAFGRGSSGRGR